MLFFVVFSLSLSFLPPPLSSRHPQTSFFNFCELVENFPSSLFLSLNSNAFAVEKKSHLSSLPSFQKSGFKQCFHCVFSAEHVINIYTFRTSSNCNYTHCRYARASSFSLSAVVRANDVQEEEEHSSSLSFFLYSHPRVHKLFSIIIIHNS